MFKCYNIDCPLKSSDDRCGIIALGKDYTGTCKICIPTLGQLISSATEKIQFQLEAKRREIEDLVDFSNSLHSDMAKVINSYNEAKKDSSVLKNEVISLVTTVYDLVTKIDALKHENKNLRTAEDLNDGAIVELRDEIRRLDAIIVIYEKKVDNLREEYTLACKQLIESGVENRKLKAISKILEG